MLYLKLKNETEVRLIMFFIFLYVAILTTIALYRGNSEFMYYSVIIVILLIFFQLYHKKIHLPIVILASLSLLGLLHLLGGSLYFDGIRLYDTRFLFGLLKYDNIVHILGAFIMLFASYNLLRPHITLKVKHTSFLVLIILILITLGLGVIVELLELFAVIFFNASQGVGDYLNNALDLFFNTIGAIFGAIIVYFYHKSTLA